MNTLLKKRQEDNGINEEIRINEYWKRKKKKDYIS